MICPASAIDDIIAAHAVQRIGPDATSHRIGGIVACAVETPGASIGKNLNPGCESKVSQAGEHGIPCAAACIGSLDNRDGAGGHDIGIVSEAAGKRIGTGSAIKPVVTEAADQGVVAITAHQRVVASVTIQCVVARATFDCVGSDRAERGEVACAGEHDVLDIGERGQCYGRNTRPDRIFGAFVHGFNDHIERVIDDERIVTRSAQQRIRAAAANQGVVSNPTRKRVITSAALNGVGTGVTGSAEGSSAGKGQRLDIGKRCNGRGVHCRKNRVVSCISCFNGLVQRTVENIGVVSGAAEQAVVAACSVERIGTRTTG